MSKDLVYDTSNWFAARMTFLLEPMSAVERPEVFEVRIGGPGISGSFLERLRKSVRKRHVPFRIAGEE